MEKKLVKIKNGIIPLELHKQNEEFRSIINSAPSTISKSSLFSFMKKLTKFYDKVKSVKRS